MARSIFRIARFRLRNRTLAHDHHCQIAPLCHARGGGGDDCGIDLDADCRSAIHQCRSWSGFAVWPGDSAHFAAYGPQPRSGNIDDGHQLHRSEEHTSELQSLMRNSYAVFCLKKKKEQTTQASQHTRTNLTITDMKNN